MFESEPIDIIDLTQDLSTRSIRARNSSCDNAVNSRTVSQRPKKKNQSKRTNQNNVTLDLAENRIIENHSQTESAVPVEVIDLDSTLSPKQSGACFFNDSVKRDLVVLACPICLEELTSKLKPTSTKCGHIFCANCLQLAMQQSKKCPTCKMSITAKSCTRLYF